MTGSGRAGRWTALVMILAVAAALRAYHLGWGLPHYFLPDEGVPFRVADQMVGPLPEKLGWQFFNYPHLHVYLLRATRALCVLAGGSSATADLVRLGRWVTVVFAVATVAVIDAAGRALWSARVGLLAALFTAIIPAHAVFSHIVMVDVPVTFWVALSFLFAAWAVRGSRRWLPLAGLAAGLAGATKYPGLAAVFPPLGVAVHDGVRATARRGVRGLRRPALLAVGVAAACVAGFALGCPLCVLHAHDWRSSLAVSNFIYRYHGSTISLGEGSWVYRPYVYQLAAALPFGLGWPLYLVSVVGLVRAAWRRETGGLLALAFVVPYFAVVAGARAVYLRYYVPLLPFLALAAAAWLGGPGERPRTRVALLVAIVLYTALFAFSRCYQVTFRDRHETVRWLLAHAPGELTVAVPAGASGYDGLQSALPRRPDVHVVAVTLEPDAIRASPARFLVLSFPDEILRLRRAETFAERRTLEQLHRGELGYRWVRDIPVRYFSDRLYTALDPIFQGEWADGGVGFRIYERVAP